MILDLAESGKMARLALLLGVRSSAGVFCSVIPVLELWFSFAEKKVAIRSHPIHVSATVCILKDLVVKDP